MASLFLDEFPEFGRTKLEVLRQPLEDRLITISQVNDTVEYPADFILVAAASPCPCVYYGTARCSCEAYQRKNYQNRVSGPIMDRIDLFSSVQGVQHTKLLGHALDLAGDQALRQRVANAQHANICARAYMRMIKVARTVADLEHSPAISLAHLNEAIAYRRPAEPR